MQNSVRSRCYKLLNEPDPEHLPSVVVACLIAFIIILNVAELILSTMKGVYEGNSSLAIYAGYGFTLFFTLEYFLRVWVAADSPSENKSSAWQKRRAYMLSPIGLVDFLSSLPLLIWAFFLLEEYADFRIIKLIALVRIFKLTRYSSSMTMLVQVFNENKHTLFAAVMVMCIMMILAASGIYLFERELQPDSFGSIPASMWWAFVTLTTVGYGDVVPITLGGRIFGVIVMVCGVGVAAMPAGIFASSFVQLAREQEKQRRFLGRIKHKLSPGGPLSSSLRDHHHTYMSLSEQREVNYLMEEFGLSLDQAVGVVSHFRRDA